MSAKLSKTTSDFLEWHQSMNLVRNLYNDKKYRISLLVAMGSFWGLRISDLLSLRWEQVLNRHEFELIEKKTGKIREIRINNQLIRHIDDCYNQIHPKTTKEHIFLSQKRTVYSVQRVNVILKDLKTKYNLKIRNFSSHSLRKTFGREIFARSGTNAELAIVKLSELFNHSSTIVTRRYLGITKQELLETYNILTF